MGLSRGIDQGLAGGARATGPASCREPMTSQVTTTPGGGSRRQTSSNGPVASTSANPTRCDLAGRTHSPLHGDAQRMSPGHIRLLPKY